MTLLVEAGKKIGLRPTDCKVGDLKREQIPRLVPFKELEEEFKAATSHHTPYRGRHFFEAVVPQEIFENNFIPWPATDFLWSRKFARDSSIALSVQVQNLSIPGVKFQNPATGAAVGFYLNIWPTLFGFQVSNDHSKPYPDDQIKKEAEDYFKYCVKGEEVWSANHLEAIRRDFLDGVSVLSAFFEMGEKDLLKRVYPKSW